MRNLEIGALRSLVAIADTHGVTKAAQQNHLTQSAVSMQIKRLEQTFNTKLLHREGRGVVLTSTGQQLVSYARRLIELNDETWSRLTNDDFEGELKLGVPIDLVYPNVPVVLQRMTAAYPRIKLSLVSSLTKLLKKQLREGQIDLILTTEKRLYRGGETLFTAAHRWMGVEGGQAHLKRPLPIAISNNCALRPDAIDTLDRAQLPWEMVVDTNAQLTVNAMVSADLAVSPTIGFSVAPGCTLIADGLLPALPEIFVNMYVCGSTDARLSDKLAQAIREAFCREIALQRTG